MLGQMIVHWTARLAVAGYVARLVCDARHRPDASTRRAARCWWTIGCAWFVLHVIAAFHFEHHWNHAAAYEATAKRTAEMTGWNSGSGLYINEVFLCLWVTDVIIWWRYFNWPENGWAYWTVQGVFAFLMIQATAVFGPPFWKPLSLVVIAVLIYLRWATHDIEAR